MKLDLSIYLDKYQPQLEKLQNQLAPIKAYWQRLTGRDQQILIIAGVFLGILLVAFIISSAIGFTNSLKSDYTTISQQRIDAQIIARQFKDLSLTTPNDFSSVNSERVKGDAAQTLAIKDTDVIIADNTLTVKANNVKFEAAMSFLDQLRRSYGLFPDKLKITRLSQSGYVALSVSFNNIDQQ